MLADKYGKALSANTTSIFSLINILLMGADRLWPNLRESSRIIKEGRIE